MGRKMTPSYINLFMDKFEQEAIAVAQLSPDLFPKLQIVVKMFRKNLQSPVWRRHVGKNLELSLAI